MKTKIVVKSIDEIKKAIDELKLSSTFHETQEKIYQAFASRPSNAGKADFELRKIYLENNRSAVDERFRKFCREKIAILVESGRVSPEQRTLYVELGRALNDILDEMPGYLNQA